MDMESHNIILYSGAGQSMWQVIVGRVISGSGGAGLTSLAAVIIAGKFALTFEVCMLLGCMELISL